MPDNLLIKSAQTQRWAFVGHLTKMELGYRNEDGSPITEAQRAAAKDPTLNRNAGFPKELVPRTYRSRDEARIAAKDLGVKINERSYIRK